MTERAHAPLQLEQFERRLRHHPVVTVPKPDGVHALQRTAVAAILRFERGLADVLLMKRAERAGDRWSGHISMPGGRESDGDSDLLSTAIRETHEEVGIDLRRHGRVLGQLRDVRAVARGRVVPMTIAPYVFVQTEAAPIVLGHEAQDAFWLPLDRVVSGALSDEFVYTESPGSDTESPGSDQAASSNTVNGQQHRQRRFPCWRYRGYVVWGLTYYMLSDLLSIVTAD